MKSNSNILSKQNGQVFTPDNENLKKQSEYMDYYKNLNFTIKLTKNKYDTFSSAVIFNDYGLFLEKVYHTIKAL